MSWRDHLKVHPAADLFPLMSESERRELGEDIKANGLTSSIVLCEGKLLDGRNRLDAMESVGLKFRIEEDKYKLSRLRACDGSGIFNGLGGLIDSFNGDPYAFVLSANLHRRRLTGEQKRDLIAKVLKAKPEASNRQIATQVKAHHTTVGTVRAEMESTGEISQLEKTTGADGKQRKKRKKPAKKRETNKEHVAAVVNGLVDNVIKTAEEFRSAASAEISRAQNAALDIEPAAPDHPVGAEPALQTSADHLAEFIKACWTHLPNLVGADRYRARELANMLTSEPAEVA
jgi:hypothetical protein